MARVHGISYRSLVLRRGRVQSKRHLEKSHGGVYGGLAPAGPIRTNTVLIIARAERLRAVGIACERQVKSGRNWNAHTYTVFMACIPFCLHARVVWGIVKRAYTYYV